MSRLCFLLAIWGASAVFAPRVAAHESLPIVVELAQHDEHGYSLALRFPGNRDPRLAPEIKLDGACRSQAGSGRAVLFACDTRPNAIRIGRSQGGPAPAVLLRARFLDGTQLSATAPPGETTLELPKTESWARVLGDYIVIGFEHIMGGFDHLLFLFCLVLVARTWKRTALTVTGFTVGHALTITAATLGLVRVNSSAVEAVIALSIAFLAAELVRGDRRGATFRYPAVIAGFFGLLHGLGFAGALAQIGVSQTRPLLSLVGFNLGVELGQLAFVGVVLSVYALLRRLTTGDEVAPPAPWFAPARVFMLAATGVTAGYWFVERMVGMVA